MNLSKYSPCIPVSSDVDGTNEQTLDHTSSVSIKVVSNNYEITDSNIYIYTYVHDIALIVYNNNAETIMSNSVLVHVCTNTPLFHSTMLNDVIVHVYVIDVGMNVIFHSHVLQRQANMILYHIFSASTVLQLKESRLMRSYIHANLAIHNITHNYCMYNIHIQ